MAKLKSWVCMADCYVSGWYFEEGTKLTLDEAPCRHFVEEGMEDTYDPVITPELKAKSAPRIKDIAEVITKDKIEKKKVDVSKKRKDEPDDDPRTNKQLREACIAMGYTPAYNVKRSTMIKRLRALELAKGQDATIEG